MIQGDQRHKFCHQPSCVWILLWTLTVIPVLPSIANAEPNQLGQTGLINMPDARIEDEGTLRFGLSYFDPYAAMWSSVSFFPWLELSARYTEIDEVEAFVNKQGADFGDFKDKAFDTKLRLWKESTYLPEFTIGLQDFTGTQVFDSKFATLSKRLWDFDLTIGYGTERIDGMFGGLRYKPDYLENWSFVAEYDAFDYPHDRFADVSGAINRKGKTSLGINYQWGWLGSQLAYQDGDWGIFGYVAIPLAWPEFIPKIHEPEPYTREITRVSLDEWNTDQQHPAAMIRALETQGFKNVRLWMNGQTLEIGVATPKITLLARAAGRTVRTALLMSPTGTQSIKVTYYTLTDLPVVSYHFTDLEKLDLFFSGKLTYGELLDVLKVEYAYPELAEQLQRNQIIIDPEQREKTQSSTESEEPVKQPAQPESQSLPQPSQQPSQQQPSPQSAVNEESAELDEDTAQAGLEDDGIKLLKNEDGQFISLRKTDNSLNTFNMTPLNIGVFFNDPSGALKYDWFMKADYRRYLGSAWFFESAARVTVAENVSDVTQPSNSLLPHVRTDVADYKRERGVKLDKLLVNKFYHLRPRLYARTSLGIYEEMYGGTGGQLLYLPKDANWATDLSVDWVKQRDFGGGLAFREYDTVTAMLAYHYRVKKYGLTFTLRGGRFLAKDEGARLEISRRFRSGVKVGAWYTYTDGDDTTGPGSVDDPYQDKGLFLQIPLSSMLPKDTRAVADMSIRPWTRDVGQMVKSPGDLYDIFENVLVLDRPDFHLLKGFHD